MIGGCHGDDEREVFSELCVIVDEAIQEFKRSGKPLPEPTANRGLVNKLQFVA